MIPKTDVAQVVNQVKTVPEGGKKKISFKRSRYKQNYTDWDDSAKSILV